MFVDDYIFTQIESVIRHSMTASIEVLYIILGYPDIQIGQDTLSLDKYYQSIFSNTRVQLCVLIKTRAMTVGLFNAKCSLVIEELAH